MNDVFSASKCVYAWTFWKQSGVFQSLGVLKRDCNGRGNVHSRRERQGHFTIGKWVGVQTGLTEKAQLALDRRPVESRIGVISLCRVVSTSEPNFFIAAMVSNTFAA
jgi:hypothetical protein